MAEPLSIESVKRIQRERRACDVHFVSVGSERFTIAHTDAEREAPEPLEACPLHQWLTELDGPPAEPGLYVAIEHEPDAYSEPLGADPWDLLPTPVETSPPAAAEDREGRA